MQMLLFSFRSRPSVSFGRGIRSEELQNESSPIFSEEGSSVQVVGGQANKVYHLVLGPCPPARMEISGLLAEIGKNRKKKKKRILASPGKSEKISRKIGKCHQNPIFEQFSFFSAHFFRLSGGGRNPCFSYFFPISGRRPEIGILAGRQGRKPGPISDIDVEAVHVFTCWRDLQLRQIRILPDSEKARRQ